MTRNGLTADFSNRFLLITDQQLSDQRRIKGAASDRDRNPVEIH